MGGEIIPLVGLLCNNCYNIRFFSAILMGVTPKELPVRGPAPDA